MNDSVRYNKYIASPGYYKEIHMKQMVTLKKN